MSDFFLTTQEEENNNTNIESPKTQTNQSILDYNKRIEDYKTKKREHYVNAEEYGVELPDGYYEAFRPMLANAKTQEERQELAYKLGTAAKYSELMGEPIWDVFQNVDAYSKANFPNLQNQKDFFEATSDMITLGNNNVKLGLLGHKLSQAQINNDTELIESYMAEINAINQRNETLQQHIPDKWWKEAVEVGAPSIPFTGYVAAAGLIGNFIAPAVGTGASFAVSSYLSAGQEYLDMIANGSKPETARIVSSISGIFQGAIEADLGITSGLVKGSAKLIGKEAATKAAKRSLEEIGQKVFKRFHFGPVKKLVTNFAINYAEGVIGEGLEEASQNVVSVAGKELAAILDGYDIPDDDIKSIVKDTMEQFRGGMLGAVFLGVAPAGLNATADAVNYAKVKRSAETIESSEAFYSTVKDNPIFEGMSDTNKRATSNEIWENAQLRKEEKAEEEARKIAEIRDVGEGTSQPAVDENGNEIETEPNPVARNEAGRLFTQEKKDKDESGNVTGGTFLVGDRTQSEENDNRYGYIKYSQNENGDINIDNFYMKEEREGLRKEVFEEFARIHPGVNIEWNTKESEAASLKEELIKNNPSGEKNGLNYYSTRDIDDIQVKKSIGDELRQNIHNYKEVKYFDENNKARIRIEQSELTTAQVASMIALMESGAKRMGLSLSEYYEQTFAGRIFGTAEEFENDINDINSRKGSNYQKQGKAGAMVMKKIGQQYKAVIYAAENADYSTFVHEMGHIFQMQLTGDLKKEAETAFNVVKGNWEKSTYTFSDGRTMSSAEAFAWAWQDWLETGKVENEKMKNIFQQFAKFLADAFNQLKKHLNITPQIESVFNKLLDGDDTIMSKALKAAEEEEKEYRAKLKRDAEEKQARKKAEAEQAKKQTEAEREEASEITEYSDKKNEQSTEEIEEKLNEVTNEKEPESNAIDNALEDLPLTDDKKAEIAEVLKDETSTVVEKAEAATEAASSVYDEVTTPEDNEEKSNSILNGEPVHEIKSAELNIDKNNMKESGIEYIRNNPQGIAKTNIGDIEITEKGVKQSLSHTLSLLKVYAIPAIKDVLEKGTYLGVIKDLDGKRQNNYYFAAPITIDDKKEILFIRVKHVAGRNKVFYVHDIFTEQEINEAGPYSGEPIENRRSLRGAALAKSIIQDYEKYNKIQNDYMLFQIAGEIGAENLDNSEVQEGVSRMQNLAIAKQMDAEKKDAQAIRLATGWEKGDDGKWKYEIDDSKITVDFYAGMKVWEKEHPEFVQLRKRILKGETLTEAEQERFKTLYDEWDKTQDSKKEGEFFKLEEVLDFPELFKAYPTFKNIDVYIGNGEKKGVQGEYESDLNTISLYKEDYEKSPIDWTINAKSVLLHEIQHAIQYIEGFAKGGSDEQFEAISVDKLEQEIESLQKIANGEKKSRLYSQGDAYHRIEELQARIEEIEENALDGQVEVNGQVYENEFEAYRALAGEVEARNVQTRINFTPEERRNTLLAATEDVAPEDKIILFQQVYHGSGADFDKFDTENFGLSGEGSMSFGYGTYVTDSEEIARDYANRAKQKNGRTFNLEASQLVKVILEDMKKGISFEESYLQHKDKYIQMAQDYINDLEKNTYFKPEDKEIYKKAALTSIQQIENLKNEDLAKGYLYTAEIPDDGYLDFNKKVGKRIVKKIAEELEKRGYKYPLRVPDYLNNAPFTDKILYGISHDVGNIGTNSGTYADLYELIGDILAPSENRNTENKKASSFLHSIGYVGIKYPAGTIHGNGNGAYNYVIFNDEDAKIVDKLLFQTQAELMDEARTFETWQEFMAYCEESNDEGNVFESDEAWYKSFWEQANGIAQEQEKKAEAEERRQEVEADTPEMVDRLFISYIKNNPEVVDNFVQQVTEIMEMDLGGDEWAQVDEEGGRERERYAVLQDYISAELSDGNWQTAIAKVQGGHELSDYIRKRLITEMTDSYKARDFRNLYAAVMKEKRFTVDALDTRADELLKKLEKNPKRYFDILAPTEDVTVTTPQRRKEIAREMQNRDMAARIKAGSLKVDDEVINYLKSVEKKEKDLKKQEQQLTDKIQGLYNDVGNTGLQMLINTHEKLMEQKARLNNRNADTQRKIEKGLRMTDRYTRQTQNMTQTYHELERKFSDLKDSMVITSEVQQILDAQEQRREIREEVARISKERYLADETKKIRVNLVKQLFRKVPLDKVDFKQAQLIIAIQKLTLPNMIGGVNRWIGRNSPFLNAVLSRIVTDSEYKERIVNYLEHVEKQTDTFRDFVESIRNAKSREDFENWGVAEREYAIKYLPKENWVWELKLKEKARELQESLHLDITQEKVERQVYDADGHPVEDDEGKPVMETAYQFKIGDEALNKLLQETLGDELFNRLMNSPMVEWSTQEMEELVARVNQIRDEGITMRAAKLEARKREAQKFMQQVADAVKDTGIVINEDDTPEEKEKKLEKINKILGKNKDLKGTEASKDTGFMAKLNRILHGYKDANVLRIARILDNQKEGVNTYLLYRREDDYYNKKMRSIMSRGETVHKVMAANNINEGELAKSIEIEELGTKFTIDELLFFLAADKDFQLDENGNNDNYAATSRNAVCFGNMMSDTASQELKEGWAKLDAEMKEAIEKDHLTPEQRQLLSDKQLDTKPGTTAYIRECNRRWEIVLRSANELLNEKPEYNALLEAIQADYADQYERMNEVSINEFNVGVNRVKCYVPLVRREQNGETNENQVMEDLLAINGVGKSGVNKGMTQSRTSISPLHQRPVQTGLFRTWCDSVERTEHFIAYAPYVRLLNRVYNSRDAQYLRSDIEGRYGKGMLDYIDAYISEVANPNAQNTRSSGAELLHILRGKTAPAYLGWKASAIIKQGLTSPWPYMQFVNPAEYLKAAFKCNNPKMWEAIQEKSVFMKNRRMDPMNDLVDEMAKNAKNKADKFWSNFTKKGMEGLEWIDWACVAPGWYACYEKKYNQLQNASEARYNAKMAELEERNRSGNGEVLNPTQMETIAKQELLEDIEMEAVTYADDCTRQCQPSNRLTDLAPMFKDKNEFKRAFLQFQTSLNVIWQNIRYDMPYAVKNKEYGRIVGTVLGYVMAGVFMNSVMEGVTSGADGDDDKDKQALRNLIFYATTQFTDAVPMLGSEITNMNDQWITGKRGFMNSGTDMTPTATKLISAFTTATKGNWEKAAALTAEGIGLFMGAPVSGVKEINKLLGKPLTNGDVDLLRGLSDVYGIAGDILEE